MKKAAVADVKARFGAFLDESRKGPVIVMRDGKAIAVLMGVHNQDELDRLVFASSRRLHEILDAGRKDIREGRGIPNEEFWKQVEAERSVTRKRKLGKKKSIPA